MNDWRQWSLHTSCCSSCAPCWSWALFTTPPGSCIYPCGDRSLVSDISSMTNIYSITSLSICRSCLKHCMFYLLLERASPSFFFFFLNLFFCLLLCAHCQLVARSFFCFCFSYLFDRPEGQALCLCLKTCVFVMWKLVFHLLQRSTECGGDILIRSACTSSIKAVDTPMWIVSEMEINSLHLDYSLKNKINFVYNWSSDLTPFSLCFWHEAGS